MKVLGLLALLLLFCGADALRNDTAEPERKRRRTDGQTSEFSPTVASSSVGPQANGNVTNPIPLPNPVPVPVPVPTTDTTHSDANTERMSNEALISNAHRVDRRPGTNANSMDPLAALDRPDFRRFNDEINGTRSDHRISSLRSSQQNQSSNVTFNEQAYHRVDEAADFRRSHTNGGSMSCDPHNGSGRNHESMAHGCRPPTSSSSPFWTSPRQGSAPQVGRLPSDVPTCGTPGSQRIGGLSIRLSELPREDLEALVEGYFARTPSRETPSARRTPQDPGRDGYSPRRLEAPPGPSTASTSTSTSRRLESTPGPSAHMDEGLPSVPESIRRIRRQKRTLEEAHRSCANQITRLTNDSEDCDVRAQERRDAMKKSKEELNNKTRQISTLTEETNNLRMAVIRKEEEKKKLEEERENDRRLIRTLEELVAEDQLEKEEFEKMQIQNLQTQWQISRRIQSLDAYETIENTYPEIRRYQSHPMAVIRLAFADQVGRILELSAREIANLLSQLDEGGIRHNADWLDAFDGSEWRAIFGEGTSRPHWRKSREIAALEKRAWPNEAYADQLRLRLASYLYLRVFHSMAELTEFLNGLGGNSGLNSSDDDEDGDRKPAAK